MEYITEVRGGWDEWNEKHEAILGVRIDGEEFDRFLKEEEFTNKDGNPLEVEFPRRTEIDSKIRIEQYNPKYKNWKVRSLNKFEEIVDTSTMTINVSEL